MAYFTPESLALFVQNNHEAIELLYEGADLPLLINTFPLAFMDKRCAGYPIGGSTAFVRLIERRYLELGGSVFYSNPVNKIIVKNNSAAGISLSNGHQIPSDYVVSAADWNYIIFHALNGKYTNRKLLAFRNLKKIDIYYSAVIVFLGLNRTLFAFHNITQFPLDEMLSSPDQTNYYRMELHNHSYDPTLAPDGKSVISVCFYTQKGDYWIDLRKENILLYNETKNEFAKNVIEILEKKIGNIRDTVEEMDVITPATFYRYTNNTKGSTQGWLPNKKFLSSFPLAPQLPKLSRFVMAGHWLIPGGGLPIAIKTARDAAMIICHSEGIKFKTT